MAILTIVVYSGDVDGQFAAVGVFTGRSDGTLNRAVLSKAGLAPNAILAGRFNAVDRKPDIVVSDCAANSANVLINVTRH